MNLELYPEKQLKKEVRRIFSEHLDLNKYKVFFFGSRVKGDNFSVSDIDIGVMGKEKVPYEIKAEIEEEIDRLPTLYSFDIIDFSDVSEKFKEEALKNIEYV